MRRRSKKAIFHVSAFLCILLLIIFLSSSSPKATFAWTTIRYKTLTATLPAPLGICPGLKATTKPALIVSRVSADGDAEWVNGLRDLYHPCIYTADAPPDPSSNYLQVPMNRGHEAMAYLTFLIDNYDHFPASGAVFVHGSRWAWHNDAPDYDNVALLSALNVSAALRPWGYHNMRCDWSAGTCPLSIAPQGSLDTSINAVLDPWNARAVSDAALPSALASIFGADEEYASAVLGRGDAVRAQCCAQFALSRASAWQHERREYVALRQWLLDGSAGHGVNRDAAPSDDRIAGRILSYLWHILFVRHVDDKGVDLDGLNSRACPSAGDCYCRLYGRCDLQGCTTDQCRGQYTLPPDYKLPADWAATHS
ncbi:hypothetical protein BDV97DRAFT_78673 [Delphinella strobiligena]|nr:hypothetical protein BDV97DRAFT_78673 [Delphinella strobiligena]